MVRQNLSDFFLPKILITQNMKTLFTAYFNTFKGLSREVWWLALITLINRAGTMVIPFLSIYLTDDLHFTLQNVGWIMSVFGAGSVLGSWIGGKLTDQIGYYKVMVFSLFGSAFLFVGLQYLSDFYTFSLGIFVLMSVADMFRPAMFVALNAYSLPKNKTRSLTLIRLAINLGFSAGPAVGGLIILKLSYAGLFWVDGITCAAAGLLLVWALQPKKARVYESEIVRNPVSAYSDRTFLYFLLGLFIMGVVFLQCFSTIPLYYKNGFNLTEFQIGLLMGLNGVLIFVFEMPLIKYLEDSKFNKKTLITWGALLIAVSYVILNCSDWTGILIINMVLITLGEMILFPFSNAFALERSKKGKQGQFMAMYSIAFSFAHIFGHNLGMQSIEYSSFASTWYLMTFLGIIGTLILWNLKVKKGKVNA